MHAVEADAQLVEQVLVSVRVHDPTMFCARTRLQRRVAIGQEVASV